MLGITLKAKHFGRYKDIVYLVNKYGRAAGNGNGRKADPAELANDLERLGPTFIKLGQLLSTRPDLLSEPQLEALARLQDDVQPFPFKEAERIIESELKVRARKIFIEIDERPTAAASLAQIHRAKLRDGAIVAVKVQRPGIQETIIEDMAAIGEAASFLDGHTKFGRRYEFARMLEEFRKGIMRELDFEQEAVNLRTLAENLRKFDLLVVPSPHEDFTTSRVLTMNFIEGRNVNALTSLRLNEVDGPRLADQLFRAYLKQILVDGFFHADPHPGNIVLGDDGRIAILDLGMVGRLGPQLQQDLLALLLAVSEGRSEDAAAVAIKIGSKRDGFAEDDFRRALAALVLENRESTISQLEFGQIILRIARISGECSLRLPSEITMIGKALLNLDRIVWTLDPDFEPSAVVREEATLLGRQRLQNGVNGNNMTSGLLEIQSFAGRLPDRINKVLDVIGSNELRMTVDALDEHLLIHGMQKIANRIALGLVLAALIIGAALMIRVPTTFRIFDYPGLPLIFFLAAATAGVVLILDILYYDDKRKTHLREPKLKPPAG